MEGDGTAIERPKHYGYEVWLESDRTKPVSFELWAYPYLMSDGQGFSFDGGALFRVLPRLDLEILPTTSFTTGERRFTGMGTTPGEYVFGRLSAKSIGTTVRATYTFTPHLTLARFQPPVIPPKLLHAIQEKIAQSFGSLQTAQFHLIESKLKPAGAEYTTVQSFRFAAEA